MIMRDAAHAKAPTETEESRFLILHVHNIMKRHPAPAQLVPSLLEVSIDVHNNRFLERQ